MRRARARKKAKALTKPKPRRTWKKIIVISLVYAVAASVVLVYLSVPGSGVVSIVALTSVLVAGMVRVLDVV